MKGRIKYSLGRTINNGNFENAKIEVGVELDIQSVDEESLDDWYEKTKRWVNRHVKEEEREWLV